MRWNRLCSLTVLLAVMLIATALLAGCASGSLGASQATTLPTATPTLTATPTAAPMFTPTPDPNANPYPPYSGKLLWNDPLTSNNQGHQWDEGGGVCQFSGGAYQVVQAPHVGGACFEEGTAFSNFTFQVKMTFLQHSSTLDGAGIVFRADRSNRSNYYVLALYASGSYYLGICAGSDCSRVVFQGHCQVCQFGPSQSNTLAVVANGNSFTFYVNGQQLASGTNSVYSQGAIGFFGVALGSTSIFAYQNLKVWQL
jgi:hypothetical protein